MSFAPATAAAGSDLPSQCSAGGYIADRMVPTKEVAESIYRAVGQALSPWNFKRYPIVVIEDHGDHWEVSQTDGKPAQTVRGDTITEARGGGQLDMNIDKCTGAISHAAFNR